jgi:hypothetical protein
LIEIHFEILGGNIVSPPRRTAMESADRSGIDFRAIGAQAIAVVLLVPTIAAGLQQFLGINERRADSPVELG